LLNLSSGYVQRSIDALPMQGSRAPWTQHQNHIRESLSFRFGAINRRALDFRRHGSESRTPTVAGAAATPAVR
jgi:hypothetical protein